MSKQGKFYTYTLAYESGIVFYVGKGKGKRITDHEREARRGVKSHKCNTIRKIWASGEQIVKTILAYFESELDALVHEIALVFFLRPYGNLTNVTDGGEGTSGYHHSEATRQKFSIIHSNKVVSVSTRQKISAFRAGKPAPMTGKRLSKYVPQHADMTDEEYQRERNRLKQVAHRQKQHAQVN